MAPDENECERLLARAREGEAGALGRLLERYRAYLTLLARVQIGRRLTHPTPAPRCPTPDGRPDPRPSQPGLRAIDALTPIATPTIDFVHERRRQRCGP